MSGIELYESVLELATVHLKDFKFVGAQGEMGAIFLDSVTFPHICENAFEKRGNFGGTYPKAPPPSLTSLCNACAF